MSKWELDKAEPTPYQNALFEEFRRGAERKEVRMNLRNVLIAAGVVLALALLLKHLIKRR